MCAASRTVCTLAVAWVLAAGGMAVTAATPPTLEVTVPPGAVSVGDRVPVRVTAVGGDDWRWGELAVHVEADGPWAVVSAPRALPGSGPPLWELVLAPMAVGEQALPALAATARPPGGDPVQVTATALPTVTVASVLPPGDEEKLQPAPLRDPVGAQGFPWEWLVPAALALVPLLTAAGWWRHRRRRRGSDLGALARPPLEELEAVLSELEALLGREPAARWCDRLAGAFRRFLERRSEAPALEMTSFELRALARRERWPEPVQRSLHRVMTLVDGVRFSRWRAEEAELRAALAAAREAGGGLEGHLTARDEELEAAS